ncbi:hypothetical protein Dimus_038498 [Dionaea muscipula]
MIEQAARLKDAMITPKGPPKRSAEELARSRPRSWGNKEEQEEEISPSFI